MLIVDSEGPWFSSKLGAVSCEAWRAEGSKLKGLKARVRFCGGAVSTLPTSWGPRSAVSSPSAVWVEAANMLFVFWDELSCYGKSCVHCASLSFHSFFVHVRAIIARDSQDSGARLLNPVNRLVYRSLIVDVQIQHTACPFAGNVM